MSCLGRRALAGVVAFSAGVAAKKHAQIDAMKHDIREIYMRNFDSVIGTELPLKPSAGLYFKEREKDDKAFIEKYNEVAGKAKKMLKVAAMDCDDAAKHCDRVGVK